MVNRIGTPNQESVLERGRRRPHNLSPMASKVGVQLQRWESRVKTGIRLVLGGAWLLGWGLFSLTGGIIGNPGMMRIGLAALAGGALLGLGVFVQQRLRLRQMARRSFWARAKREGVRLTPELESMLALFDVNVTAIRENVERIDEASELHADIMRRIDDAGERLIELARAHQSAGARLGSIYNATRSELASKMAQQTEKERADIEADMGEIVNQAGQIAEKVQEVRRTARDEAGESRHQLEESLRTLEQTGRVYKELNRTLKAAQRPGQTT
jgi:methyl-accepting chemotaxis protein